MEEDQSSCSVAQRQDLEDLLWVLCSPWCSGADVMDRQFCSSTSQTLLPAFHSPTRAALSSHVALLQ